MQEYIHILKSIGRCDLAETILKVVSEKRAICETKRKMAKDKEEVEVKGVNKCKRGRNKAEKGE
jgi:hypothetical protein